MKKNLKGAIGFAAFLITMLSVMLVLPAMAKFGIICPWVPVTVAAVLGVVMALGIFGMMIYDVYQGHDDE